MDRRNRSLLGPATRSWFYQKTADPKTSRRAELRPRQSDVPSRGQTVNSGISTRRQEIGGGRVIRRRIEQELGEALYQQPSQRHAQLCFIASRSVLIRSWALFTSLY